MAGAVNPPRVLVVDDEVDFATATVDRLRRRGIPARAVFSGEDALAAARSDPYDVVVLDLKMPRLDGLATLRELRRLDGTLQVIVLTGHGSVAAGVDGMTMGAADFLQKPAAIDVLCSAIEAAAERTRTLRALATEGDKS